MRLVSKSVLLAVAAFALSGVAAAAASASAAPEWLLNGGPVTESKPVTDSATAFTIRRTENGTENEESFTCALSGKGTVSAKGVGAITAWNLTSCVRHLKGEPSPECEAGTLSGPTALHLPWKTQLVRTVSESVRNEVHSEKEAVLGFTWQCKVKYIIGNRLYSVSCHAFRQENNLTSELGGSVWEAWEWIPSPELECERSLGSEKLKITYVTLHSGNHVKAEKGELSFK